MAWSAVTWAYKDLVTSAKLAQMQENIRTHDHRADGTQGDPTGNIAGPTYGAAAATIAVFPTQTTMATITLPATKRASTLFVVLTGTAAAGTTDAILAFGTLTDSRVTIPNSSAYYQVKTAASQFFGVTACLPVAAGAASGTFVIQSWAIGAAYTAGRVLWWLNS